MGRVTVIVSGKGGVGKSTLCAGLGIALGQLGKRVLLIDGDAGLRSLDTLLGVTERLAYDMGDLIQGRCAPHEAIYATKFSQLYLLPAQQGKPFAPHVMKILSGMLAQSFDEILIDAPAGLGAGVVSVCSCAAQALLVTTVDPISVRAATRARELLDRCEIPAKLVMVRFQEELFRQANYFADLDDVIDQIGAQLLGIVPHDPLAALPTANGQPMCQKGEAAKAFLKIARRLNGESVLLQIS